MWTVYSGASPRGEVRKGFLGELMLRLSPGACGAVLKVEVIAKGIPDRGSNVRQTHGDSKYLDPFGAITRIQRSCRGKFWMGESERERNEA